LNPEEKVELGDQEIGHILPSNQHGYRKGYQRAKLTDEEIIMGRIHGTIADGESQSDARPPRPPMNNKPDIMTPMTPMLPRSGMSPFGGVFDGNYQVRKIKVHLMKNPLIWCDLRQGPKLFSQSVMTKTVRKPDGSYETTKVTQDSSGHKTTTITRMIDGRKETTVTHDGGDPSLGLGGKQQLQQRQQQLQLQQKEMAVARGERNIFVTKEGYAMPRNLW